MSNLLDRCTWLLAPGRCLLCSFPSHRRRDLCRVCEEDMVALPDPCALCALPLPAAATTDRCALCRKQPPRFARLVAACSYEDPADLLVQALKFRRQRAAARVMAEVMCDRLGVADLPTTAALVPVPLHRWRQWRRGFNQSVLLAEELSRLGGWRVLADVVRRHKATRAQSGLTRPERRRNLAAAFSLRARPLPDPVILVDDVVTTGATLDAVARVLRRAGVTEVLAWCFARTPGGSD